MRSRKFRELYVFSNDDKFWQFLYQRDISEELREFRSYPEIDEYISVQINETSPKRLDDPNPLVSLLLPSPISQLSWKSAYIKAMSILSKLPLDIKTRCAALNGWEKSLVKSLATWKELVKQFSEKCISFAGDKLCIYDEYIDTSDTITLGDIIYILTDSRNLSLQKAAVNGHFHIVKLLVEEENVDVTAEDSSALVLAALGTNKDMATCIVKYLAEKGADIWAGSEQLPDIHYIDDENDNLTEEDLVYDSDAPISFAIKRANLELFKYILGKSIIKLKKDIAEQNIKHTKSDNEFKKLEEFLITNYINKQVYTALIDIIENDGNNPEVMTIIKYLIEEGGANINRPCYPFGPASERYHLIDIAIESENEEIIKYFIDHGCDVNNMSLDSFAETNNFELIKYLFEKGYNNEDGKCSGLITAADSGHFELVKYLVEKGTNVNGQPQNEQMMSTPLIQACKKCQHHAPPDTQSIIDYLIEKGADVTYYDNEALKSAIMTGNIQLVKYLLAHGASINAVTSDMLVELIENCSTINNYVDDHMKEHIKGYMDTFNFVLLKLPDIFLTTNPLNQKNNETENEKDGAENETENEKDGAENETENEKDGAENETENGKKNSQVSQNLNRLLLAAIKINNIDLVKYCVQNGADIIHDKNENSKTVRLATEYNALPILKYLKDNGADVHDNNDQALRDACRFGFLDIVKYLVENNADVNSNSSDFCTPLKSAGMNRHYHIIKYLLEHGAVPNYSNQNNGASIILY